MELHGQYLAGKVLGHGGFGVTYLGWDLNLARKIAIKEYLPIIVAVRTGANSEVIPFSGDSRKDFEYGLERYLDEARTTIMAPVLEALGSVHQQDILHRDISPDNIYITRKWRIKVLDFGAARYALGRKSRNLSVILESSGRAAGCAVPLHAGVP
ncbi:MAG: hypothetical protein IT165_09365 [Bryobacterales bacterium]|nr:hypothetical protein [Bryobacterales bacterium]